MESFVKEPNVVPYFYTATIQNDAQSKLAGRPIFDEVEMCDIRLSGDRNLNIHVPAHEMWERRNGEEVTYAMRWPDQYAQFKNQNVQVASGTPLEELPFLSAKNRSELKALQIYTAESLASLEGKNLKSIGMQAYSLKEQAQAYLDKARGFAGTSALIAQNDELQAQVRALAEQVRSLMASGSQEPAANLENTDPYEGLSDDDLKEKISNLTGSRPRGNPSRPTLVGILNELNQSAAA